MADYLSLPSRHCEEVSAQETPCCSYLSPHISRHVTALWDGIEVWLIESHSNYSTNLVINIHICEQLTSLNADIIVSQLSAYHIQQAVQWLPEIVKLVCILWNILY